MYEAKYRAEMKEQYLDQCLEHNDFSERIFLESVIGGFAWRRKAEVKICWVVRVIGHGHNSCNLQCLVLRSDD